MSITYYYCIRGIHAGHIPQILFICDGGHSALSFFYIHFSHFHPCARPYTARNIVNRKQDIIIPNCLLFSSYNLINDFQRSRINKDKGNQLFHYQKSAISLLIHTRIHPRRVTDLAHYAMSDGY